MHRRFGFGSILLFCFLLTSQGIAESPDSLTERLERLLDASDPTRNYTLNPQRAELIREALADSTDIKERLYLEVRYASELLNAGKTEAAIHELESLDEMIREKGIDLGARNTAYVRRNLIIAYLRLGEQENCLANHTTQSCLLPIAPAGVHERQRGSRRAMELLLEQLAIWPNDLEARWLLNVAAMTVGEYPHGIPEAWRIDPEVFESDAKVPRFTDVASGLGLDVDGLAGGSIVEDFDRDGNLDVMVSSSRMTGPLRYFRNMGNGGFEERTAEAGLTGQLASLNMTTTDYDNDGYADVLVLRGGWLGPAGELPNSLLHNSGDGTFTDVTDQSGLLGLHPTQTATWFDYNNDGLLDLFIGNETGGDFFNRDQTVDVHPAELFRNNGDGTFTDCASSAGADIVGYIKAVASGDYDNDGQIDLFISRSNQPNVLLRNTGPAETTNADGCSWRFVDVTETAGVAEPVFSFPAWFWDYDNDGQLDIFVAGYRARHAGDVAADYLGLEHPAVTSRLFRNKGDGTFMDVSAESGLDKVLLAMGSNYGDIDSDGFLDFYIGTGEPSLAMLVPNRLFRNDAGRAFLDVTTSAGVGHLQKGHGVSFADIDNDGDQDIYHCLGGAFWGDNYRNALFENPGNGNHWITLKLEGTATNRAALGTHIAVTVSTSEGERTIRRTVSTGGSFGVSPLRQQVGLGRARGIERIEVRWPATQQTQVLGNLEMDRFYMIREGEPGATMVNLRHLDISPEDAPLLHAHTHTETTEGAFSPDSGPGDEPR